MVKNDMSLDFRKFTRVRFTLIELLVVIAIILILAALLMPALSKVRYRGQNLLCLNNMKELALGSVMFTGDHDGYYADRGVFDGRFTYSSYDRWAFRKTFGGSGGSLDDMLDDYVPSDLPTWTCPLYQGRGWSRSFNGTICTAGGYYGCTEHGVAHTSGEMTYSFHVGVKAWEIGDYGDGSNDAGGRGQDCWAGTRHRIKAGDPMEIDNKGTVVETGAMISHMGGYYRNAWTPSINWRQANIGTIHMPPPGTTWTFYKDSPRAELSVYGSTVENWAFDDGSASPINTPFAVRSSEYIYVDNMWMYPY